MLSRTFASIFNSMTMFLPSQKEPELARQPLSGSRCEMKGHLHVIKNQGMKLYSKKKKNIYFKPSEKKKNQ